MRRRSLFFASLGLCLSAHLTSCRGRGSSPTVDPVKSVEIETVDISGVFKPEPRFTYQLSDCGNEAAFQELDASDKLIYKIRDLKSGDSCKLAIIDETRRNDKSVKWIEEPGTLYWTKSMVVIERGNRGQLRGVAMLSPGFVVENEDPDYYKLSVPVTFSDTDPKTLDLNALTASLTCDPAQSSTGVFAWKEGRSGQFNFLFYPPFADKAIRCTRITISYEGSLRWRADIASPEEFTADSGGTSQLVKDALDMKAISEETASGIEVILAAGQCKEGEVFDPMQGLDGECVPVKK